MTLDRRYLDDPFKAISPEHNYVLEHTFYKTAVQESWPGWENVKWVPMDVPQTGRTRTMTTEMTMEEEEEEKKKEKTKNDSTTSIATFISDWRLT